MHGSEVIAIQNRSGIDSGTSKQFQVFGVLLNIQTNVFCDNEAVDGLIEGSKALERFGRTIQRLPCKSWVGLLIKLMQLCGCNREIDRMDSTTTTMLCLPLHPSGSIPHLKCHPGHIGKRCTLILGGLLTQAISWFNIYFTILKQHQMVSCLPSLWMCADLCLKYAAADVKQKAGQCGCYPSRPNRPKWVRCHYSMNSIQINANAWLVFFDGLLECELLTSLTPLWCWQELSLHDEMNAVSRHSIFW